MIFPIAKCQNNVCCTKIINLTVEKGNLTILDNVNLHIHCKELTAIVGPNGAGKTTFLKALLGEVAYKGSISFVKENTHTVKKPSFGYVPQSLFVNRNSPITVADLIRSCLCKRPVWLKANKNDITLVQSVLATTNAQHLLYNKVASLSGGEIQRIMLSLAIHPIPDILLLDEPISGIDRNGTKMFYELVSNIRKNADTSIILISHDLDLVAKHADRVVFLMHKVIAQGRPREVYNTNEFIRTFGHINIEE